MGARAAAEPSPGAAERLAYAGHEARRLSNGRVELIATVSAGPRVLRYGFAGGPNVFAELPHAVIETELGAWRPYGGHRLWIAPEQPPCSFAPDNDPVEVEGEGARELTLRQAPHPRVGVEKRLRLELDASGPGVTVTHWLRNLNPQPIEMAAWGITVMREGVALLPQEPFRPWEEAVLPARPMVLWHYTDLRDPRWTLGERFIRLRTDAGRPQPQKIGAGNAQGWLAHAGGGLLFVKRFAHHESAAYPDFGCNAEAFTAGAMVEIESLGPMTVVAPGESIEHRERWHLFDGVHVDEDDAALEARLRPLIAQVAAV